MIIEGKVLEINYDTNGNPTTAKIEVIDKLPSQLLDEAFNCPKCKSELNYTSHNGYSCDKCNLIDI